MLVLPVALLAHADDHDISGLRHATPLDGRLTPFRRLGPDRREGRAVKARYVGVCRGCGAYTQPRNGKGDAYAYCKACHPGAIERRWTRELVISAMLEWCERFGRMPSSYDWSRTHARRRGKDAARRLAAGHWPSASVVTAVFGSWALAREAATEASSGDRPRAPNDRGAPTT